MATVPDAENFDSDGREALIEEAQFFGNRRGHIQNAPFDKRPPVIHTHDHGASIAQIGDANAAGEGEGFMRGGFGPGVLFFTDGGFSGEKQEAAFVVVGGDAFLDKADGFAGMHGFIGLPAHGIGPVFVAFVAAAAAGEGKWKQKENPERAFHKGAC